MKKLLLMLAVTAACLAFAAPAKAQTSNNATFWLMNWMYLAENYPSSMPNGGRIVLESRRNRNDDTLPIEIVEWNIEQNNLNTILIVRGWAENRSDDTYIYGYILMDFAPGWANGEVDITFTSQLGGQPDKTIRNYP